MSVCTSYARILEREGEVALSPELDRRRAPRTVAALGALLLSACSSSPTGVVVVFDADHDLGSDGDELMIVVTNERDLPHASIEELRGPEAITLPSSFGIVGWDEPENPEDGSLDEVFAMGDLAFEVELRVRRDGDEQLVTGAASRLVVGRVTKLELYLASRCREEAASCLPDETCSVEGCRPLAVDPDDLPAW